MFSGIVQEIGTVSEVNNFRFEGCNESGDRFRLKIDNSPLVLSHTGLGGSIAVEGTCLTVIWMSNEKDSFLVELGEETLKRTTLGMLQKGQHVNLERSLRANDLLGGHIVQGHVDGVVKIDYIKLDPKTSSHTVVFEILDCEYDRNNILCFVCNKGFVCIDGISLTVVSVSRENKKFSVMIIPETWSRTTISEKGVGCKCNIEVDSMGKMINGYLETLISTQSTLKEQIHKIVDERLNQCSIIPSENPRNM